MTPQEVSDALGRLGVNRKRLQATKGSSVDGSAGAGAFDSQRAEWTAQAESDMGAVKAALPPLGDEKAEDTRLRRLFGVAMEISAKRQRVSDLTATAQRSPYSNAAKELTLEQERLRILEAGLLKAVTVTDSDWWVKHSDTGAFERLGGAKNSLAKLPRSQSGGK